MSAQEPTPESGEQFLLYAKASAKYLDICDYVNFYETTHHERVIIGAEGEEQIVIRGGGSKVHLEQVSPLQWMGASLRIMQELISRGILSPVDSTQYLGYMAKISDFAPKFTWLSLLHYDREYRHWQA